jgi:hypothetical protein
MLNVGYRFTGQASPTNYFQEKLMSPRSLLTQWWKHGLLACTLVSLLAGCAPGTLSNMWRDPYFQSGPMKKMFIIAIRKDPVRRRIWEDGFVAVLSKHGVVATPSYRLFPNALPDSAQYDAAVEANGYDGILVTRRLRPDTLTTYVPGYTKRELVTRYNPWRKAYQTYYQEVQVPGYTETDMAARHEVNVWTTTDQGGLVWAGTGRVVESGAGSSVNDEIVELIVPQLEDQGIIPKEK